MADVRSGALGLVLMATVTLAENLNGAYLIGNPGGTRAVQ